MFCFVSPEFRYLQCDVSEGVGVLDEAGRLTGVGWGNEKCMKCFKGD